ncbi:MAG: shikimate dehydrogenase, partial [Bacteroidetes bacterium HGW-Bacteroidetes-22]
QVIRKGAQIYLTGHNTDVAGIQITLSNLGKKPNGALIFGTGGAAAATSFVLNNMRIPFRLVSRTSGTNRMIYNEINPETIRQHHLLINCTPVGTSGFSFQPLPLPYDAIGSDHILFDLVYNPAVTSFLKEGLSRGATCVNGYQMLIAQAEETWRIWMKKQ